MSQQTITFVVFIGYWVVYIGLIIGIISWVRWRRKTRWPFKDSDKLLREPGESLRRKIVQLDERATLEIGGALVVGALAWPTILWFIAKTGLRGAPAWIGPGCGLLVVAFGAAWRIYRLLNERRNRLLGWFGERIVAEKLRPLAVRGYHIFHDIPGEPGDEGFNIDHVAVGPTGVTVIEVKTRRKGNARLGYKDHEVSFNGSELDWPWGRDRHGIQQALNEADWLAKWIHQRTGLKVAVNAVLALPGWFVRETPSPYIRVVNPSFLPDVIQGKGTRGLSDSQIDLVARQLEIICRDVVE
ncbi:MAG TPA: nuclease-related domain-containing protein [Opitutaceae bacterium]|nr:nuclease-related domain-containing protein [Opitutaceae bacterium]